MIDAALARAGLAKDALGAIATPSAKGGEAGIAAAASTLGVPLILVPPHDLEAAGHRTLTRSERVVALMGVPSVAEAAALESLAPPAAIFVGGGAAEPGVLDGAIAALRPRGRLVVNAVTLDTEALLLARHAAMGGELIRIGIARAAAIGGRTGWRPALPVTQWVWVKP